MMLTLVSGRAPVTSDGHVGSFPVCLDGLAWGPMVWIVRKMRWEGVVRKLYIASSHMAKRGLALGHARISLVVRPSPAGAPPGWRVQCGIQH